MKYMYRYQMIDTFKYDTLSEIEDLFQMHHNC